MVTMSAFEHASMSAFDCHSDLSNLVEYVALLEWGDPPVASCSKKLQETLQWIIKY